jgi:hypothetical protein
LTCWCYKKDEKLETFIVKLFFPENQDIFSKTCLYKWKKSLDYSYEILYSSLYSVLHFACICSIAQTHCLYLRYISSMTSTTQIENNDHAFEINILKWSNALLSIIMMNWLILMARHDSVSFLFRNKASSYLQSLQLIQK